MARWTDKQRNQLRRDSIPLGSDVWFYEEPNGLSCYSRGQFVGTIQINTIRAYVKRWEKANGTT